jgi:CRISPR-associated protein Cas5d
LRKGNQLQLDASYQLIAVILVDVCYRLYGEVKELEPAPGPTNHLHTLQAMFERRAANGQAYATPCLGWKEFTPTYFGPFREGTRVEESIHIEIPSMLHEVFDRPANGRWNPRFVQGCRIEAGVLHYAE